VNSHDPLNSLLDDRGFGMSLGTLVRISARSAGELCQHVGLGQEARDLLGDDLAPRAFLERLLDGNYYQDAVRFLAHALPKREAVWWGCLCVGHAAHLGGTSQVPAALQAAVQWVVDPSDQNRRAAEWPGGSAQPPSPSGCLAVAAFLSGGGMHPPKVTGASAAPFLAARTVGEGILLAATGGDPAGVVTQLRAFLALGIGIANGKYLWDSPVPQPDLVSAPAADTVTARSPEPGTRFPKQAGGRTYGDRTEPGRWS
jgi:hypothetical protein